MKHFPTIISLLVVFFLIGCGDLGYYLQGVEGHLEVMNKQRDIPEILADPQSDQKLKDRLGQLVEIRDFASRSLLLPDNQSYRSYADLERNYVVWNVVATPEFSTTPLTWCFPVAGCVPYRGYFKQQDALDFAETLRQEGRDVLVYGVVAYSTLNWFDDPALNTFTERSESFLAALIFHELAHQVVYLPGEAEFNEAFAKTVEIEGVRRWLTEQGHPDDLADYNRRQKVDVQFIQLARRYQKQLATLYQRSLTEEDKRSVKADILQAFKEDVRSFEEQNKMVGRFDHWLSEELNNARFASLSTYHDMVPAFQHLLQFYSGDLSRFYAQVTDISRISAEERSAVMQHLLKQPHYSSARQTPAPTIQ